VVRGFIPDGLRSGPHLGLLGLTDRLGGWFWGCFATQRG
jgi:hypothetical protein